MNDGQAFLMVIWSGCFFVLGYFLSLMIHHEKRNHVVSLVKGNENAGRPIILDPSPSKPQRATKQHHKDMCCRHHCVIGNVLDCPVATRRTKQTNSCLTLGCHHGRKRQ